MPNSWRKKERLNIWKGTAEVCVLKGGEAGKRKGDTDAHRDPGGVEKAMALLITAAGTLPGMVHEFRHQTTHLSAVRAFPHPICWEKT